MRVAGHAHLSPALEHLHSARRTALFAVRLFRKTRALPTRESKLELGAWIADSLQDMGLTYVKLGQFLTARTDVLDVDVVKGMEKLQDGLPGFRMDDDALVRKYALQASPIACASIAAVYVGVDPVGGATVAVKVQRPDMRRAFDTDLRTIDMVLSVAAALGLRVEQFAAVLRECRPFLYAELDTRAETHNALRFGRAFDGDALVRVPRVLKFGARHVVMEYVPGTKISDLDGLRARGVDTVALARDLMRSFAVQLLRHGFIHADLHSGNIAVDDAGRIVFYDYGCVVDVAELKENLGVLVRAAMTRDVDALVSSLVAMGVIAPGGNRRALLATFASLLTYMDTMDVEVFQTSFETSPGLALASFQAQAGDSFRLNARFVYLLRSLSMVEGIARALDPDFKYAAFLESVADLLPDLDAGGWQRAMFQDTVSMPSRVQAISLEVQDLQASADALGRAVDASATMHKAALAAALLAALLASH